jgi:hypothetical protein
MYISVTLTASVIYWSEFLATDPGVRFRFLALPDFLEVAGLERGLFSLVSTIEELLGKKSSGSGLENRGTAITIRQFQILERCHSF